MRAWYPNTIVDRTLPNTLGVVNWNGVLSPTLFGNFQVSRKQFGFRDSGGTSTDIVDSPYLTRAGQGVPGSLHYNAPYFDSTDPEDRNNWQFAGSLAHFRSTEALGTHDVKAGFEFFNSTRIGGNSQSATGFVFHTAYENVAGDPIFGPDGRLIPMFIPGHTLVQNWLPVRGARIDIGTLSFYVHDRWMASRHFTLDLGVRYERVRGEATGDIVTVDTDTVVPRLGATYDVLGDGRFVVQSSYAHYAGKYSEAQFARTTNVGIPNSLTYIYDGPQGAGRTFAPGLDIGNYQLVGGSFPLQTVFFDDALRSPTTREFTFSVGGAIGADGYGRVISTRRDMTDFVESFITMDTGQTTQRLRQRGDPADQHHGPAGCGKPAGCPRSADRLHPRSALRPAHLGRPLRDAADVPGGVRAALLAAHHDIAERLGAAPCGAAPFLAHRRRARQCGRQEAPGAAQI
jgi:hypothetical protein